MSDEDRAKAKIKRFEKLKARRSNWESHWDEVIQYVIPRFENTLYTQDDPANRGEKTGLKVFESTAVQSNELLASALHGLLTSPSSLFLARTTGHSAI